jgi:hypothetical protein
MKLKNLNSLILWEAVNAFGRVFRSNQLADVVRSGIVQASELPMLKQSLAKAKTLQDTARLPKKHREVLQKFYSAISSAAMYNPSSYRAVKRNFNMSEGTDNKSEPPQMLILKRTGIRIFPNGERVAMYVNDKTNMTFTVPYNTRGAAIPTVTPAVQEETENDESLNNLSEARIKIVKARIRGGKVQRRKKVSNVPGYTIRGGKLTKMSAKERLDRKRGARKAKVKTKAKLARALVKRKRSLRKRKALGL